MSSPQIAPHLPHSKVALPWEVWQLSASSFLSFPPPASLLYQLAMKKTALKGSCLLSIFLSHVRHPIELWMQGQGGRSWLFQPIGIELDPTCNEDRVCSTPQDLQPLQCLCLTGGCRGRRRWQRQISTNTSFPNFWEGLTAHPSVASPKETSMQLLHENARWRCQWEK